MGDHLYAYGVVDDGPLELSVEGVEGATEADTVDHRRLSMVVTEIDTMDPERTDENSRAHDDVLRAVMDEGVTVVPMQFGMTFKNARTVKGVLRGARPAFTRALRDIDGKVELGVKLVVDEDAAVDHATVEETVSDRLDDVSVATAEGDLFSDRLAVNRSYLVEREDRDSFDAAVSDVDERYDGVTVRYTGPWAPYNFVDIEVGAEH